MAQNGFGRRQLTPRAAADRPATSGRSSSSLPAGPAVVLVAVGGLAVLAALGVAFALNAATRTDPADVTRQAVAAPQECRGQAGCTNQYNVGLKCDGSEEAKSVSVVAADAEAAEHKAERYNRDCRSHGAVFVTSLVKSAASNAFGGPRAAESPTKVADRSTTASRRGGRFRRR